MVVCPVCQAEVALEVMNVHLDSNCLVKGPEKKENTLAGILTGNRARGGGHKANKRPSEGQARSSDGGSRSSDIGSRSNDSPVQRRSFQLETSRSGDGDSSFNNEMSSRGASELDRSQSNDLERSQVEVEEIQEPPRKKRNSSPGPPPYSLTDSNQRQLDLEKNYLRQQARLPLAERLRPKNLDQYIGQQHLVGKGGILRGFIEKDRVPSMILWGPPGVGKTTLCRIIANVSNSRFVELSATANGINDCRKVFEEAKNELRLTKRKTLLFCDEIHRFNKAQQDIFLPYVEKGDITLIGATTENPSFQLNSALLSRCRVFTLEKLSLEEVNKILNRAILATNKTRKLLYGQPILKFNRAAVDYLGDISDGDSRSALNLLEITDSHYANSETSDVSAIDITPEGLKSVLKRTHMIYDRVGDAHYDTISLFHKSVRGSDADAALYYLARMLEGGENPLYIARRMIRIASEDVGCLDDSCLPFAVAAYQAVQFVGLPEADMALVHCAYKLAKAPKSIEIYRAWSNVRSALREEPNVASAPIPLHLRNAPTKLMESLGYSKGYKYNPDYVNGKVKQEYLPPVAKNIKILENRHLGEMVDPDLD